MPPGVPADRVAAMQAAFFETYKDPEFVAGRQQARARINSRAAASSCRSCWKASIRRHRLTSFERLRKIAAP